MKMDAEIKIPASATAKMMTAMVVYENIEDLSSLVAVYP